MASKPTLDLSLYLVTDSTQVILGDQNLLTVVEDALRGGVTIVQYREKTLDSGEFVRVGKRLHEITQKYQVPLIINDRVDVALAIGAEGVHLGQDDMDIKSARKILGPHAIIGATVSSAEEAWKAVEEDEADYLGIGTVYATPTKEDTKSIIGTAGVKNILSSISKCRPIPAVAIGGVNSGNVQRILYQCHAPERGLNGVAVVSAIMAAADPSSAAKSLLEHVQGLSPFFVTAPGIPKIANVFPLVQYVPHIVKKVGKRNPLSHNMTNKVVQNFAANVVLAIGASPIMSSLGAEAPDLAALKGGLVINLGQLDPDLVANYAAGLRAYNDAGGPVVLDPVGAGATAFRRETVNSLLKTGYFDVIKGNEGEIKTVWGQNNTQQHGVDSGPSTSSDEQNAHLVRALATRERNVVLMTGAVDFLSDGERTLAVYNGHEFLGRVTGTGCCLAATIAAFLAVYREDKLLATLAGMLMFEIAAENAASKSYVKGPGSFVPTFLDELYNIYREAAEDNHAWCSRARVVLQF